MNRREATKNPDYRKIMGSRRWKELRMEYITDHPLCECCLAKGKTTPATEVHHIIPIEREVTMRKMEELAFSEDNLMSVCFDCHHLLHELALKQPTKRKTRMKAATYKEGFANAWLGGGKDGGRG
jgi:5-methylcytosine-specific restriction protein A